MGIYAKREKKKTNQKPRKPTARKNGQTTPNKGEVLFSGAAEEVPGHRVPEFSPERT